MKRYIVEVQDPFYNITLNGIFYGNNETEAKREAVKFWQITIDNVVSCEVI